MSKGLGMSKGLQIALAVTSVFGGLVWLLGSTGGAEGTFRYYTSIAEYRSTLVDGAPAASSGPAARVHGHVVAGSIERNLREGFVDFELRDKAGETLPVRLDSIELPDLFRDDAEVVVEGRADGAHFAAAKVFAKCPSKYEAASEPSA